MKAKLKREKLGVNSKTDKIIYKCTEILDNPLDCTVRSLVRWVERLKTKYGQDAVIDHADYDSSDFTITYTMEETDGEYVKRKAKAERLKATRDQKELCQYKKLAKKFSSQF